MIKCGHLEHNYYINLNIIVIYIYIHRRYVCDDALTPAVLRQTIGLKQWSAPVRSPVEILKFSNRW